MTAQTIQAFCSWSGGKDSALALYRMLKDETVTVTHCLNMVTEDCQYGRSHGVSTRLLRAQVEAMGLDILQQPATWQDYEGLFKEAIMQLKRKGISAGIFGDIDLEAHREWEEKVCSQTDIKPFLPLWLADRQDLMEEFITAGFQAVVTVVNPAKMDPKWLGRKIDHLFIDELKKEPQIDLCGENGEYHTLVVDGPMFRKRIDIETTNPCKIDDYYFLNITGFSIK
ncbi:MAG: diphthine--ammonia ligase [bacterium]|nr:diphthine--ammonia ligase [bacterium]